MKKPPKPSARRVLPALAALALLGGCGAPAPTAEELWKAAMQDAVFSEDSEVMELVTLTPGDPHVIWDERGERVLLLTWHDYDDRVRAGRPGAVRRRGDLGHLPGGDDRPGMESTARAWRTGSCASPSCWGSTRTRATPALPAFGSHRRR